MLRINDGEYAFTEKKSKFLAFGYGISGRADVKTHVDALRAKYPDATHVCYGFIADGTGDDYGYDDERHGRQADMVGDSIVRRGAVAHSGRQILRRRQARRGRTYARIPPRGGGAYRRGGTDRGAQSLRLFGGLRRRYLQKGERRTARRRLCDRRRGVCGRRKLYGNCAGGNGHNYIPRAVRHQADKDGGAIRKYLSTSRGGKGRSS